MKKVFTHENRLIVFNMKNLLEERGIECLIKNEFAGGGVGDLAPFETWPELWVVEDEDFGHAQSFLHDLQQTDIKEQPCPHCGEMNALTFKICWACEKPLKTRNTSA